VLYSRSNPSTHVGSFFGNAIADWTGVVITVVLTRHLYEKGSTTCKPPKGTSLVFSPRSGLAALNRYAKLMDGARESVFLTAAFGVALPDAAPLPAVIVEPVACSAGVLIPPKGYLKRLAAICAKHDILLIFDEVITAFGRLGAPFGVDYFGVSPDIITTAKGITNGTIPMGAVFVKTRIHDAFMNGPQEVIDLFHGYTYSGHPVACAAAIATLETYKEEGLLTRASELAPYWEDAVHSLKGLPHVIDIRNIGLIGAIEFDPIPGEPSKRAHMHFVEAFKRGLLVRATGDIIALSPPLIIEKKEIDQLFDILSSVLKTAN